MKGALRKIAMVMPMLFFALVLQAQDLSLAMRSNVTSSTIGGNVVFTIVVRNGGTTSASGVTVTSKLPASANYVSDDGGGAYVNGSGLWTVGNIAVGDSAKLNVTVSANTDGVIFGQAEVTTSNDPDPDSTPGNGVITEDDWSSTCFTVPMHFNCVEPINVLASAPAGYLNYQWYLNGSPIVGAVLDTYRIVNVGNYTFSASNSSASCPASFCCPIAVVRDPCMSIGNFVFDDTNNNGTKDVGEAGLASVEAQLWNTGLDGLSGTGDDFLLQTQLTDATGHYLFTGLIDGTYFIKLTGTGIPANYVSSTGNGINDVSGVGAYEPPTAGNPNDTDNGFNKAGVGIISNPIVMSIGKNPVNDGDTDPNTNLLVDFGLYLPEVIVPDYELTLSKSLAAGQISLVAVGDTIRYDLKVKNTGLIDAYDVDVHDQLPANLTVVDPAWTLVNGVATRRVSYLKVGDSVTYSIKTVVNSATSTITNLAQVRGSDRPNGSKVGEAVLANNNDSIRISLRTCVLTPEFTITNPCVGSGTQFNVTGKYGSWTWNFGDGTSSTLENPIHVYPNYGTYTVSLIVTDTGTCSGIISKPITINPAVTAYASIDRTICAGDSVHLNAQGGTHYKWLTGTASLNDIYTNHPAATPSVTTSYVVAVSSDYGCTSTDTVVVFVNPKPVIVTHTGNMSTCTNGTMPASITIDQPIASYDIVGSAGWKNIIVNGNTITFDAILNGTYDNLSVTLKTTNGCSITDKFYIYSAGNPQADFAVVEPFCYGTEIPIVFTGKSTPGATLTYSLGDGVVARQSAATATRPLGDTTFVVFPTFGSKIIKLVVNDGGCLSETTKSIFVRKTPNAVIANNDSTICPGACVNLYGTSGVLDCVYAWGHPAGLSATNIANPQACPTATTTYYLTVTDINGCASKDSVTISVDTNLVTLIGVPNDTTVNCTDPLIIPTVTALNGEPVTFKTNTIVGACPGSYTIERTWTATGRCNFTKVAKQTIIVNDNVPPVFSNVPADETVQCDNIPVASTTISASDACSATTPLTFNEQQVALTCAGTYQIIRTWTASDACGNVAKASQNIFVKDTTRPVFTSVPADVTVNCDDALPTVIAIAKDNCSIPTITMSDITNSRGCTYTISRIFTATDACGNLAQATQTITVNDTKAPVITSVPVNITVDCEGNIPATLPIVTDACDKSPIITVSQKTIDSTCYSQKTILRTWTAVDACGNSSQASQTVRIFDSIPPVISPVNPQLAGFHSGDTLIMSCENLAIFQLGDAKAVDNCDGLIPQSQKQFYFEDLARRKGNCNKDGYSLLIDCQWYAVDKCGNASTWKITIKVVDNTPPVLANCPAPANVTLYSPVSLPKAPVVTATDNCTDSLTVAFNETKTDLGVNCDYTLKRTWSVTDDCSNTSTCSQILTVHDSLDVKFVKEDVSCAGNDGLISMIPSKGLNYNWSDSFVGANRTDLKPGTYTVTVTNNRTCEKVFTINVLDNCACTPPVATIQKADATCGSANGTATITVDSVDNYTYVWSDGAANTSNTRSGLAAGTYTATVTRVGAPNCKAQVSVDILNNTSNCCTTAPVATITKVDATCGSANGTATVKVDTIAKYTYTWSDGKATTSTRTALAAGTYSVTVSRIGITSCTTKVNVTIANNTANCCTPPVATVTKVNATCGAANGTATVKVDTIAKYTYTWSDSATVKTSTRLALAAGSYTVTVAKVSAPTCTAKVTFTVLNDTSNCCTAPVATINKFDATCGASNGSVALVVDNTANYTFTWADNANITSNSRTDLPAGNYAVTVSRVGVTNCATPLTLTINNNVAGCCVAPVATINKFDATCGESNGTVTLVVDNTANYTFTWADNANITSNSRTDLPAGNYAVTVSRVGVTNCATPLTFTINNNVAGCCVAPVAGINKFDATCGESNGTVALVVDNTANYTFTWADNANITSNSRNDLPAGNYAVTVSRIGVTNCLTRLTFTINNNVAGCCVAPVATAQTVDATCGSANGSVTLTVDNVANYVYRWADDSTVTSNTRKNLAAGTYTVTVARIGVTNCSTPVTFTINDNTTNCCGSFIAQASALKVITNCTAKADVCIEIPSSAISTYLITDNGSPYTSGFGTCTAGSTLYFAAGDHTVIFADAKGCKDTLLVKVSCVPEIIVSRSLFVAQTDSVCLTAAQVGLTGNIVSIVNECSAIANNSTTSINPTTLCVAYTGTVPGFDTACLRVITSNGSSALVKLAITVKFPGCGSVIPQDTITLTNACGTSPSICIAIPYGSIPNYNVTVNGAPYTAGFSACKSDTTLVYSYATIPGLGVTGPYSLDYWTVNGTSFNAPTVNTMDQLVDLMNVWDPTGNWVNNTASSTITGGDRSKGYGGIKLTLASNGAYGIMEVATKVLPTSTSMAITRGASTFVFVNKASGCSDTLRVNAACVTPQYIVNTMYVGDKDTLCIATNELLGNQYKLTKALASTNTYASFVDLQGTTCIARTALVVGDEKATYVITDNYGISDTTYVVTHVVARTVRPPVAIDDASNTIKAQPVLIDVVKNDTIIANSGTIAIVDKPKHGEVIITTDMRIIYTPDPNYCNSVTPDVFTYALCNVGGCDSAKVEVIVSCDKILVYNGFSPNNDGVNDTFVIEGIEAYPNNTVTVYNRWGNEVMTTKGYKNDWTGTWNGISLPDGTYFYIFSDGEGNQKVGYIQIQR